MQKIFIRYFLIIMVFMVGLTLLGNFALQTGFSQRKAELEAEGIRSEVSDRIEENARVIRDLRASLDDNYITRAHALAEIVAQNPGVLYSFDEMDRLAKVLNVEEVHVIDGQGVLRWGNVKAYYDMDFSATDQTRPFLPGLTDKSFALAQDPQPNGSIGKLFQYIGVARQDQPGIVQVGVAPEILDSAMANNKIDVVIANYNVASGVSVTAFDRNMGTVVGDSEGALLGKTLDELGISGADFLRDGGGVWLTSGGQRVYAVFGDVGGYRVQVSFTQSYLFESRKNQLIAAACSSVLLGAAIIAAIFVLLKRMIIGDVERVNRDLGRITHGDLDVVMDARSTPELRSLSGGINEMVSSLKDQMEQIASQARDLEERNHNILSSLKYAKKIQHNLLPSSKPFDDTFSDYSILWEPKDMVGGDIYWMKRFEGGAVLCVCDCTGHGTPGALLTMLVVTALDAIVNEDICADTAGILWELEQRLVSTLNVAEGELDGGDIRDGADLSILFLRRDGSIVLSSAKLHLFVCDGRTVENLRGQKLTLGDGSLKSRDQIETLTLPAAPGSAYYIVSDGLFEQVGGEKHMPFGYNRFKQIILEHHSHSQTEVTAEVWAAFEAYMGGEDRRDDVTLVSFRLGKEPVS